MRKSHAELDDLTELDTGNPQELGEQYADLLHQLPHTNVARRLLWHRPQAH